MTASGEGRGPAVMRRALFAFVASAAALAGAPGAAAAHEIPASVLAQMYVKPEAQTLRVLLRVPLQSMRDIDFPVRGRGYLELAEVEPLLPDLARLWIADYVELRENGKPLGAPRVMATRVSLPSDRSFAEYGTALAHTISGTLPPGTELPLESAMLDVLLEYDIASAESDFSITPALAHLGLRTTTVLRFLPPSGAERALTYLGDPGLVHLDPRWHQAALQFVKLGFLHILEGVDHLLFLLCLVIPFRRVRPLVVIVTSFTVAHSITLIAAALGLAPDALWFPPLVETLIAASIVFMAFENIVGPKLDRRWAVAFAFGLVHGFGFSFLLRDTLQFAGGQLATSLVAFNVGVELGQLAFVLAMVPVLEFLFRRVVAERVGTILLSALVAHSAWHWMADRFADFREYEVAPPTFDLLFLAALMRWAMLALIAVGGVWLLKGLFGRWLGAPGAVSVERSLGSR